MHVLIIPSWYPSSIIPHKGVFIREQVAALLAKKIKVGVVYSDLCSMRYFKFSALKRQRFNISMASENGVNVVRWNAWSLPKLLQLKIWLHTISTRMLIKKYIKEFGYPDIIHIHSFLWAGVGAEKLMNIYGIPIVVTEHSSAFPKQTLAQWQRDKILKAGNAVSKVIAVSKLLADSLKQIGLKQDVEIIPNLVDVDYFSLPPNERDITIFRFVAIASLDKNKGIDLLIRAFAETFINQQDVLLEIGGDGPERHNLEKLVKKLELSDKIKFLGILDKNQVKEALWRTNSFISSSYIETFGVVLIEAMSTGVPVIATKSGGPDGFVPLHLRCELINSGDISALSVAMKKHFNEKAELICLQDDLREYICQQFSSDSVGSKLVSLYNGLKNGN